MSDLSATRDPLTEIGITRNLIDNAALHCWNAIEVSEGEREMLLRQLSDQLMEVLTHCCDIETAMEGSLCKSS